MTEINKCAKCNREISTSNRLITEPCGHSKCRQCLILEENGCTDCQQKDQSSETSQMTTDSNDNDALVNKSYKQKIRDKKTAFPSHIRREYIDSRTVYCCLICNKRFNSRTQQYYHMFCNNTSNKPFKCEQCSKAFSTSSHLKYHVDGHSPRVFACPTCSKTFSKVQILRKHEKLHTTVAQECPECGVKLRNKAAFTAHLLKHKNIFPYSCNVCEKKFSLKSTLNIHKSVHSDVKKFKCDQCDKKFDRNSTLKLHIQRHTKIKSYNCSECHKIFFDTKSLGRHMKIHLGTTIKYKCSLCNTSSIRRDNMTRHIRNMHSTDGAKSAHIVLEQDLLDNHSNGVQELQQINVTTAEDVDKIDEPKTVANSSVIRCVGNVQPVIVPQGTNLEQTNADSNIQPSERQVQKPLKKKYDPREMYRKILFDDDSNPISDKEPANSKVNQTVPAQETTALYSSQQSNFSETHWRKNFKYTYQIQYD